jgi:uncharacterized membrane-anchored protein YitT (DUF2179 family)
MFKILAWTGLGTLGGYTAAAVYYFTYMLMAYMAMPYAELPPPVLNAILVGTLIGVGVGAIRCLRD